MLVETITDLEDPRIEPYRAVRERDLAGREGLFVLEGRVVLEKALGAMPERIASVFMAAPRLAALQPLLAALPAATPVYVAPQAVMDQIVGFPIHRGILALGRREPLDPRRLLAGLPQAALVVGLVGLANHDNMGGVLRNAAAFGVDGVLIDSTSCDPFYRKAIRVSVGAALTVPIARLARDEDMLGLFRDAGFEVIALSPGGTTELTEVRAGPRTAALFGAEGPGLPQDLLGRSSTVRISMSNQLDSLNVSTTSGIVLHHLARRR